MNTSMKHFAVRAAFALFVALFFVTPICTVFVPFCSVTWMLGVAILTTVLFIISGRWPVADSTER